MFYNKSGTDSKCPGPARALSASGSPRFEPVARTSGLREGSSRPGTGLFPCARLPAPPSWCPSPALPPELRFYFYLCFGLFRGWRSPRLQLKSVYHIDFLWSKPRAGRWSHAGWSQGEALGGDRVEALVTLAALRGAPHEQARAGAVKPPPSCFVLRARSPSSAWPDGPLPFRAVFRRHSVLCLHKASRV